MNEYLIIQEDQNYGFRFRIFNGEINLCSLLKYKTEEETEKAIHNLKKIIIQAKTEDHTISNYIVRKDPKFVIQKETNDKGEQVYYYLITDESGTEIAKSKEYQKFRNCCNGILFLKENSEEASISKDK